VERAEALRAVDELASEQAGLVTAAQASGAGVDRLTQRRLVEAGLLERLSRGVYRVAGAQLPDHPWIRIAWLRLDPDTPAWQRTGLGPDDGVVSHRSATVLHALGDIPAPEVELSVPRRRTTREPGVRLLTRADLTEQDVVFVSGLPVTTPERTILDLLRDHADGGHVGRVIADADRRGLVDVEALGLKADGLGTGYGMPNASGRELLSALVSAVDQQLGADKVAAAALSAFAAGAESVIEQLEEVRRLGVAPEILRLAVASAEALRATGLPPEVLGNIAKSAALLATESEVQP
jgi:putative AbiEi antitoxin of type IV toxin-antitoxin system